MFVLTTCRFCYMPYTTFFQFASLTFAISTAASYQESTGMEQFTLYWCAAL
jgi:hypothetical protein